jgi:hypothetical protein
MAASIGAAALISACTPHSDEVEVQVEGEVTQVDLNIRNIEPNDEHVVAGGMTSSMLTGPVAMGLERPVCKSKVESARPFGS